MTLYMSLLLSFLGFLFVVAPTVHAQSATSTSAAASSAVSATPTITSAPAASPSGNTTGGQPGILTGPPDVLLHVPTLSVGKIELDVEQLEANINLNAQVASLVTINAGVAVSVQKVNITIADVDASLDLTVRLGHLVDIVNRVFQSLDLNPLLITAINNVTSLVGDIVGEVDGLLGSITQGGQTLSFVVDNLGNIVQQTANAAGAGTVSSIVGDYLQNMTFTGIQNALSGGLIQKQYSYSPLNALVDIVFNAAGQVVQATVEKKNSASSTSAASQTTAAARLI
jgi:hypothetical protein